MPKPSEYQQYYFNSNSSSTNSLYFNHPNHPFSHPLPPLPNPPPPRPAAALAHDYKKQMYKLLSEYTKLTDEENQSIFQTTCTVVSQRELEIGLQCELTTCLSREQQQQQLDERCQIFYNYLHQKYFNKQQNKKENKNRKRKKHKRRKSQKKVNETEQSSSATVTAPRVSPLILSKLPNWSSSSVKDSVIQDTTNQITYLCPMNPLNVLRSDTPSSTTPLPVLCREEVDDPYLYTSSSSPRTTYEQQTLPMVNTMVPLSSSSFHSRNYDDAVVGCSSSAADAGGGGVGVGRMIGGDEHREVNHFYNNDCNQWNNNSHNVYESANESVGENMEEVEEEDHHSLADYLFNYYQH